MAAIVVALAVADLAVVLHPEQLRRRLTAFAGRFLRGEVELEDVRFRLLSRGRIKRAVIRPRAAGKVEPAGELAIKNLILEHSPSQLLLGRYRVVAVTMDEVELRVEDPAHFLETFASLLETDPYGRHPPAPVSIERLAIRYTGGAIPLVQSPPRAASEGVVLERVRIIPETEREAARAPAHAGSEDDAEMGAPRPGRRYRFEATYRASNMEVLALGGRADMGAGTLALGLRASNLELRGRQIEGVSPEVARWFAELRPSGPVDLVMEALVPWRRPAAARLKGEIEAYQVRLDPRGFARPITNVSGRVEFEGGRFRLEAVRGLYESGEVTADGSFDASAGAWPGIEVELAGAHLDLALLQGLPLPAPFRAALADLEPAGRGWIEINLDSTARDPAEAVRFRGEVGAEDATIRDGALRGLAGAAWFAGETREAGSRAVGSLRIERADAAGGLPLRGAIAKLEIAGGRLALSEVEGRLAGGRFAGTASLGFGPGRPVALDLVARGPIDLSPWPAFRPLERALAAAGHPPGPYEGGRLGLRADRVGGGSAAIALGPPGARDLAVRLDFDVAGAVSGTAVAGPEGLRAPISGTLAEPRVATPTARRSAGR